MKFQKNVIAFAVATAMMGAAVSAQAGTASATYNTYATEALSGLTSITPPNVAYQTAVVIAAGTTFTLYVQPANGAKYVGGYDKNVDITINNQNATNATTSPGTNTFTVNSSAYSSTDGSAIINITANQSYASGAVINLAAGTTAKLNLSPAATALAAGGLLNANFAVVNSSVDSTSTNAITATYPTSGIIDSAVGPIANAQQAISGTFLASSAFPNINFTNAIQETGKIDVATFAKKFTTTANASSNVLINLGGFVLSNNAGTQLNSTGADFVLGTDTDGVSFDVTGSFNTTTGNTVNVFTNPACTTTAAATVSYASGKYTVTGLNPTTTTPYYICDTVDGTTAIPVTTPAITNFKLLNGTTTVKTFGDTNLYPLTLNGTTVTLINYVPAAAAPYQTYVRVANNGIVAAPVTVSFTAADGTTIGSGTLVSNLAPGASATFTPAQVEAAAGVTLAAGDRPQLTVSAATNTLNVQAYLSDANGGFTNMTFNK